MDADACRKHSLPPPPPPPALFAVRVRRSQVADLGAGGGAAFSGPPDTPPRCTLVTVPFLWEEAPGKPKAAAVPPTTCADAVPPAANAAGPAPEAGAGDLQDSGRADQARPVPLKLPPRLQQVPASSSFVAADTALSSPKTVLQGPYYGCTGGGRSKPPRWARSGGGGGAGAFRRTPSAGVAIFSRTWSKPKAAAAGSNKDRGGDHRRDAAGPNAPWCSPASSDSSSSVSTCFGGDDHSHWRLADGREISSTEEDDGSLTSSVKITRFRRNRSLPSMTTSNLWASIRRSVKQITTWG